MREAAACRRQSGVIRPRGTHSLRTVLGKFFCTSGTLASGIPLGREGPSVQVGAGIASLLGRWLRRARKKSRRSFRWERQRRSQSGSTLTCGSAVCTGRGVGDLHAPVLGSVVLASATSWAMLRLLLGNDRYSWSRSINWSARGILDLRSPGLARRLVVCRVTKLLLSFGNAFCGCRGRPCGSSRRRWSRRRHHGLVRAPDARVGYSHVGQVLNGGMALRLMVLLLVLKLNRVVVSYASGRGGIFGPALFLGHARGSGRKRRAQLIPHSCRDGRSLRLSGDGNGVRRHCAGLR